MGRKGSAVPFINQNLIFLISDKQPVPFIIRKIKQTNKQNGCGLIITCCNSAFSSLEGAINSECVDHGLSTVVQRCTIKGQGYSNLN